MSADPVRKQKHRCADGCRALNTLLLPDASTESELAKKHSKIPWDIGCSEIFAPINFKSIYFFESPAASGEQRLLIIPLYIYFKKQLIAFPS